MVVLQGFDLLIAVVGSELLIEHGSYLFGSPMPGDLPDIVNLFLRDYFAHRILACKVQEALPMLLLLLLH